jgi:hypothetical protein
MRFEKQKTVLTNSERVGLKALGKKWLQGESLRLFRETFTCQVPRDQEKSSARLMDVEQCDMLRTDRLCTFYTAQWFPIIHRSRTFPFSHLIWIQFIVAQGWGMEKLWMGRHLSMFEG